MDLEALRKKLNCAEPNEGPQKGQVGGSGIGSVHADMALVFTCGRCNTRSMKKFTRLSYEKGVVIIQCPGCKSLHLVADNLGWFGDEKNIEEIVKAKGETVLRGKMENGEFVIS
jgi:protein import protein ZIM17